VRPYVGNVPTTVVCGATSNTLTKVACRLLL
jgi:hypothetical protein